MPQIKYMNFDLKNTAVLKAVKRADFSLFRFAGFLSQAFLFLFILSLLFVFFSLFGFVSPTLSIKAGYKSRCYIFISLPYFLGYFFVSGFKN